MIIIQTKLKEPRFLHNYFDIYPSKFDVQDNDKAMWWLAYIDNRIVGCCAAEQRTKHIWNLRASIVAPEFRRQGIYKKIFYKRLNWVYAQKPLIITVISSKYNRELYLKEGFEPQIWLPWKDEYDDIFFYKEFELEED